MFPRSRIRAIAFAVAAVPALATTACKKSEKEGDRPAGKAGATALPAECKPTAEKTGAIGWYEDDLEAAIRCATARKVPVVVDEWAPWCHTCLSMKTTVFTDPAFAELAGRFVWLSADTDKEVNADLVAAFPPAAWPTFFVISPKGDVIARFVGAASIPQFRDFLLEGEKAFLAAQDGKALDPALAELVAGERATVAVDDFAPDDPKRAETLAVAEAHYRKALEIAPPDWPRRHDVLVSLLSTIAHRGDPKACVAFATEHLDETGRAASATDFIVTARGCADQLVATDPQPVDAFRAKAITRLAALTADTTAPLSADDRSDALMNLRELYADVGKPTEAAATAETQRALLDEAAAKAPDPLAASTYNWPRSEVYAYLHRHMDLVPVLEKSAADLPKEYDPPYRLAWLYKDAGKIDEAIPWIQKAIPLAYGPRQTRAQKMLVDLLHAKGDVAGEKQALTDLLAMYDKLPKGQARASEVADAKAALAALDAAAPAPAN